jgi:hypothetical protein
MRGRGECIKGSMGGRKDERKHKKKKNDVVFMRGEWINGSMGGGKDKKKEKENDVVLMRGE